jgi:putative phage-type endonuclease
MLISELEELEDILDTLVFEEEPTIFTEEVILEMFETIYHLIDCYLSENTSVITESDFFEIINEEIKDLFYIQLEDEIFKSDYIEEDLNDILDFIINAYISTFYPEKIENKEEYNETIMEDNIEKNKKIELALEKEDNLTTQINIIENKIQKLRDTPQPVQRTQEWYNFRWNLITASNAWKAFESQPTKNQLIYEKCQPLKNLSEENEDCEVKMVNTNSPLHWGQKYEPLSVLLYERKYNTTVEDFGCIRHPTYSFLGASPDGIVVNKDSERYGRMLEIKNVVSREINGIPKKEYWVQMQLQMEVCDLNDCDFLETKFIEYTDRETFFEDSQQNNETGEKNLTISANGKTKGIILYFHTKEGKPFYSYKPLNITDADDINCWEEAELDKYEAEPYNYLFLKFIYWKVEVFSCVLVLRNQEWFKNNISQLENIWKTIEEERITGYSHRAPNKKPKKEPINKPLVETQNCLLKFTNIIKVDNTI